MIKRIALVEDDDVLRENLMDVLHEKGYLVDGYGDFTSALASIDKPLPDLAILDIGLNQKPEGGFELCRAIRSKSISIPIIFLTAHNNDVDKISGMRMGADDYLTKDESFEYILVRVACLLNRMSAIRGDFHGAVPHKILVGELEIDSNTFKVTWKGKEVRITLTQMWILQALTKNSGQVMSVSDLMESANLKVTPNAIAVHINAIRNRFKDVDPEFNRIKNEKGVGYRWRDVTVTQSQYEY